MEEDDSEVEAGFSCQRRWQLDRGSLMEGTSYGTTRCPPSYRPSPQSWGNGQQSACPSDNPWVQEICGARGTGHNGHQENSVWGSEHTKKSDHKTDRGAKTSRSSQYQTRSYPWRNFCSSLNHRDASVLQNQGPDRNQAPTRDGHDGTVSHSGSPPLSELCTGTVALCSLYYIRLKKERRLRDLERRRRVFLFRRSKVRERIRFAVMWASQLLSGSQTSSVSSSEENMVGQESQIWNTVIDKAFSRFDWIESFRMTKSTFDFLCNQLTPVLQRMDTGTHQAIPVEERLAVTLWHLGSSCDFQTMAKIFGLSRSTIHAIVHDVCEVVASNLTHKLITVPQGGVLREMLLGFEHRYGLAQVAGVIGTLHVAIGSSNQSMGQFYNTKGWHSVVLQAVVDPDFCFWDLNVGCPGSLSDSQVLVASELYERGAEGTLFPNTTKTINGIEVPIHLLGSRSYPLLPWLMTPVNEETSAATELNRRFASALTLTQIAFGRLKSRWRCLLKCGHIDLSFLPILVTACCTLHNICEGRREPFEDHWLEEASEEELEQPSEVEEDGLETEGAAEEIRTALACGVRCRSVGHMRGAVK